MIELKPCPFCGEKANLYVDHGVKVLCFRCGASSKTLVDAITVNGVTGNAVKAVSKSIAEEVLRMKTTEEIKQGLKFAIDGCLTCDCCATDCPYELECCPMDDDMNVDMPKQMAHDALEYIQQLEENRVEVVRCKDCGYWRCGGDSTTHWVCTQHSSADGILHTTPDFYCAAGRRT